MSTIDIEAPSKEERIEAGVDAAFAREGYTAEGRPRDVRGKLSEALFEILSKDVVTNKGERPDKAVTRGDLVIAAFPSLPQREEWSEDVEEREIAEEVWKRVQRLLWGAVYPPGRRCHVQRLVGNKLGEGFLLCKTQLGVNSNDAAYITNDYGCAVEDYIGPYNLKVHKVTEGVADDLAIAVDRFPKHGSAIKRGYNTAAKTALAAGTERLDQAISARSSVNDDDAEVDLADNSDLDG